MITFSMLAILLIAQVQPASAGQPNQLSDKEKKAGFELLFNGQDFIGWKQSGNWIIQDKAISREDRGGSLTYVAKKVPDDFELRFQWKVGKGSNSGVYYRPGQYEYQILDNQVHRDGKNPRTSAASLYFCMAPSHDATKPVGQWNTGRIICQGTVIQHWLNGQKVVDFDYTDPKYAERVEMLRVRGADLTARGGYFYVQDHGDPVWYRNIKMRSLAANEKIDHSPVTPQTISTDVLRTEQKKLERFRKPKKAEEK